MSEKYGEARLNAEGKLVGITTESIEPGLFSFSELFSTWKKTTFVPIERIIPYLDGGEKHNPALENK